jgi:hypothetical protein
MSEGMKVEGFDCLVDKEHKSTEFKLLSIAKPHMLAFHLNWTGFFTSFVAMFAPAAMIPVIRESIGLTAIDLGNAGALFSFLGFCFDLNSFELASVECESQALIRFAIPNLFGKNGNKICENVIFS